MYVRVSTGRETCVTICDGCCNVCWVLHSVLCVAMCVLPLHIPALVFRSPSLYVSLLTQKEVRE